MPVPYQIAPRGIPVRLSPDFSSNYQKLLEVQKPFLEKVFGRRRQYLTVNLGFGGFLILFPVCIKIEP